MLKLLIVRLIFQQVRLFSNFTKIMTKEGEWVPGKDDVPEAAKSYLTSTMFPPEDKDCKELVKWLILMVILLMQ